MCSDLIRSTNGENGCNMCTDYNASLAIVLPYLHPFHKASENYTLLLLTIFHLSLLAT
jgi:hypothetical protein